MHPYIPHLLTDIESAGRPDGPLEAAATSESFEEEMETIERWVSRDNEPRHTFGYYCGLQSHDFPPAEQLTEKEISLVCKAFEHLLFTWNSGIDLPDKLPLALRYQFMINTLDEGFTLVNSGFMEFDYCSGSAPDCVFGEYCSCLSYWNNKLNE